MAALWPLLCNREKTQTQYMQRDFAAVAFLRQISIITKLLFFYGSVEKHRQTDRTTVACDILYILFLFASFWLRRPPLVVDERL